MTSKTAAKGRKSTRSAAFVRSLARGLHPAAWSLAISSAIVGASVLLSLARRQPARSAA